MIKKNQLALILLTLVMMLTVYYIRSPFSEKEKENNQDSNIQETTGRLEQLSSKRLTLRDERSKSILELDAIIASSDASLEEKAAAIEQKKYLNALTEKELLLEMDIINKGYQDAFVHASNNDVQIIVVANEHSVAIANEIIMMVYTDFGMAYDNVSVSFSTVQEVMGQVAS